MFGSRCPQMMPPPSVEFQDTDTLGEKLLQQHRRLGRDIISPKHGAHETSTAFNGLTPSTTPDTHGITNLKTTSDAGPTRLEPRQR